MQDACYSEISPSDTGLKILIVQSRDTHACFKTIKYLIFNPRTRNLFIVFSLYKFKLVFTSLTSFYWGLVALF